MTIPQTLKNNNKLTKVIILLLLKHLKHKLKVWLKLFKRFEPNFLIYNPQYYKAINLPYSSVSFVNIFSRLCFTEHIAHSR